MAKMPGRIPAEDLSSCQNWQPPEISAISNQQVIRLLTGTAPGRMDLKEPSANRTREPSANRTREPSANRTREPSANGKPSANKKREPSAEHSANKEPLANRKREPSAEPSANREPSANGKPSAKKKKEPSANGKPSDVKDEESSANQTEAPSAPSDAPTTNVAPTPEPLPEPVPTQDDGYQAGFEQGETEGRKVGEQNGYQEGLAKGLEEGRQQAQKAHADEVAEKTRAIQSLQEVFITPPSVEQELENNLVGLVTELAKVVVSAELALRPDFIATLVQSALQALPHGNQNPEVFVNPGDAELLRDLSLPGIKIREDASLASGGCKLQAGQSSIDATLSERVHKALVEACRDELGSNETAITESELLDLSSELTES